MVSGNACARLPIIARYSFSEPYFSRHYAHCTFRLLERVVGYKLIKLRLISRLRVAP